MSKSLSVDDRLEALGTACETAPGDDRVELVRRGLVDRHYRLVARAAALAGEHLLFDLEPDLLAAYRRLADGGAKKDPQCIAKNALVRALVALDSQDHGFFLAGMRYRQLEPVWGGRVDTATDVRVSSAMGLVGTAYHGATAAIAELLADELAYVRGGAVRALSYGPPAAAEPLLRYKALIGDSEPEVTGDCFSALLRIAPDEAVAFITAFLAHEDPAVAQYAALALGESRDDQALAALCAALDAAYVEKGFRRVLIRAVAMQRRPQALDWLLAWLDGRDAAGALIVVEELAMYRDNLRLRGRVRAAVEARADQALTDAYRDAWGDES